MNEESKKLLDLHIGTAKHFINLNKANEQLLMAEIYLK